MLRKLLFSAGALICGAAAANEVVIGYIESTEPGFFLSTMKPTIEAVRRSSPEDTVRVVRLSALTVETELMRDRPDILIAPASVTVTLIDKLGVHAVATRKSVLAKHPARSVGAAVIVRAERSDLFSLEDLKAKKIAATLPNSVDGWLALCNEIDVRPDEAAKYFSKVNFLGYGMPNVVSAVLSGASDAGVITSCLLEKIEADGLIEKGALRVLGAKDDGALACRHSTKLFPDLVASVPSDADPELTKRLVIALLSDFPSSADYSWQVTSDFHSLRALQEKFHLGAWSYLADRSLAALWSRNKEYVIGAVAVVLFLLLSELRLRTLVRRRTQQLRNSFAERDRLRKKEQETRERLREIERMGAISQLCAMIAHELKQPVNSVLNYMAVLKLKLGAAAMPGGDLDKSTDKDVYFKAVDGAERESRRIAAIVDRVRAYAKKDRTRHERIDLGRCLKDALAESRPFQVAEVFCAPDPLPAGIEIYGNALEVELLFINILKNAHEALMHKLDSSDGPGRVWVRVDKNKETVTVRIADNGPALTDEKFQQLRSISESVKTEGLGLGLAIVRNIVDEHGAKLAIKRLQPCGLEVAVTFALAGRCVEK